MSSTFTQAQLAALEAAIAAGVLRVDTGDGHSITYQTMDALLRARSLVRDALAGVSPPAPRSTFAQFTKG